MATRQYIGARYVPKFADPIEWDNARSYEALEIVTYLGTSYTSKKSVPVGTAITNTEYWVATGNYNAQVEAYRQEVQGVSEDVENLETSMSFLDNINGKKIIIIGDSTSDETVNAPNWVSRLRAAVSSDTTITNLSVNGATMAKGTLASTSFVDIVTNNTLSPADIIIIYGGTNDALQSVPIGVNFMTGSGDDYAKTFAGALTAIATKIWNKNKTAKVYVISPLKLYKATPESTHVNGCIYDLYRRILETWCKWWGYSFIDGWSAPRYSSNPSNDFCTDGIHPTNVYSPILMKWICEQINSGCTNPVAGRTLDITPDDTDFYTTGVTKVNATFRILEGGLVSYRAWLRIENPAPGTHVVVANIPEYVKSNSGTGWFSAVANYKNTISLNNSVCVADTGEIDFVYGPDVTTDGTGRLELFINVYWQCLASGVIGGTDV